MKPSLFLLFIALICLTAMKSKGFGLNKAVSDSTLTFIIPVYNTAPIGIRYKSPNDTIPEYIYRSRPEPSFINPH